MWAWVTSGEPMWCNGSTLARNARDVRSSHALDSISHFYHTHDSLCDCFVGAGIKYYIIGDEDC